MDDWKSASVLVRVVTNMSWPYTLIDDQFEFISLNPEIDVLGVSLEDKTEELGGDCNPGTFKNVENVFFSQTIQCWNCI